MNTTIKRGVSLYSYQEKYFQGRMGLGDCIQAAVAAGGKGIEFLPDQMVPGYATGKLENAFVDHWHKLMGVHDATPSCMDVYTETKLIRNYTMSAQEMADQMKVHIRNAQRLGFGILRVLFHFPVDALPLCLETAENCNVKLATEIHAPHLVTGEWVHSVLEVVEKTGSKHLGLLPDLGTFAKEIPPVVLAAARRKGASEEMLAFMFEYYRGGASLEALPDAVAKLSNNTEDLELAEILALNLYIYHDPRHLVEVAPYIFHIHGKFYEMTADYRETSVDYEGVFKALKAANYSGYISSEYEGQRHIQDIKVDYDEVEQVRRHQVMLERMITAE